MSSAPAVSAVDPDIYEATCATDGSDAVERGWKLTLAQAIARRKAGSDIVICGPDTIHNDRIALTIENAATAVGLPGSFS
jgi:hypothetical protein